MMVVVRGWDALQQRVGSVRRSMPGHHSNLYAAREQIERWCAVGTVRVMAGDGAVLVLRASRGFDHLYHVAESRAALVTALALLPHGTYVTDLVGQGEVLDQLCETYAAHGFALRSTLIRMSRT